MKFYKIEVPHVGNTMIYPEGYMTVEWDSWGYIWKEVTADKKDYVLGAIEKELPATVLASEFCTELTKEEAVAMSELYETREEQVNNEAVVRRLEIKSRLGKPLTAEEEKALDPADATAGIVMSKILADKFTALV